MNGTNEKKITAAYLTLNRKIRNYILYRVSNTELAEDLLQETFLKTWQYMLAKNKKEVKDIKNFLYMVANNLVIDYYRQKDKQPLLISEINEKWLSYQPIQAEEADHNMEMALFKKYLRELEDNYKNIMMYRYLRHLSISEICRITGKSPNYISVLIYQGTKMLRNKILQEHSL